MFQQNVTFSVDNNLTFMLSLFQKHMEQNTETFVRSDKVMEEKLLTQKEVTELIGISRTTLFRLIKEGLPFTETTSGKKLFKEDEVRSFLQARKDNLVEELIIGKEYTNNEIVEIFKVGNMGGMRRSHSKNALVLISFHDGNERLYNDYWMDDIMYYTGHGQAGDQELAGQNNTLAESNQNGITVYLFEMFYSQRYQYRGIVKLIDEPFRETECDVDGVERVVWKFPLKLINEKDYMDEVTVDEQEAHLHDQVFKNLSGALEIFASASKMVLSGSERTVKATRVQFNPVIGEYVRMRANGYCELCGQKAPFEYKGKPYLMLDHIIPLAHGGKDTANNIVAVCPNCNARRGMLGNPEDNEILKETIARNEERLQRALHGDSEEV